MSAIGTKYGEPLVIRIRDLIDGYDSSSILKEYLQNADDSGATELTITFDKQEYSTLHETIYEPANGPALLISNNSIFKEKDFNSIVQLSAQGKVEDALSTGRFGQGFSSSFSISDHPSFISNGRAYWFDIRKNAVSIDNESDILHWKRESFAEIDIWLNTFKCSNLETVLNDGGTIFRLPLRTNKSIDIDNANNKISNDVFTYENFLSWCDDWKDKADSLLFLRSVNKLVLQEIDENGNKTVHLCIETVNSKEIQKSKNIITAELEGKSLNDICENWISSNSELPVLKYNQYFSIKYLSRDNSQELASQEKWAVVNGLFRGEENSLIHQTIKALDISPNPRKVLPWAGAAIQLDDNDRPIKQNKQWYTFLPLPIEIQYPVHLHGWFDLNPKRTEITYGGAGLDKSILTEWNQQLMQFGVGVAWATLLESMKSDKYLKEYYKLWPNFNASKGLDKYLIEGFYKKISEFACIYVNEGSKHFWQIPSSNIYILKDDSILLREALQEHYNIAEPSPHEYIINAFDKYTDIQLNILTPSCIRKYLQNTIEIQKFPISLSTISIKMLHKKEWFLAVVNYCSENNDYSRIEGLPLQLNADGYVHIIGENDIIFDGEVDLNLLQNKTSLFLDLELAGMIESKYLPDTWLVPSLENVARILVDNWFLFEVTIEWVEYLTKFIYMNREHITGSREFLNQLPIVYCDDCTWANLKIDIIHSSPFILNKDTVKNIDILKSIGINIVHPDYNVIYEPLAREELVVNFTAESLAKHLLVCSDYSFFEDKLIREFILDKLSDNLTWYEEALTDKGRNSFKNIPLIYTVSDKLYSVSDVRLFISTDFVPPKHIKGLSDDYELIEPINGKEADFYKKLGIKKQTAKNYILNTIIPFLENSPKRDDCTSVLSWLATEWDVLCDSFNEKQKENVLLKLQQSKIIPDQQYLFTRKTASKIYHPTIKLPLCLANNKVYKTIEFEDSNIQLKWNHFLSDLNASEQVFSDHILTKVMQISNKQDESMYPDSICLARYIVDNIDMFDTMKYSNGFLLEELKKYTWLPVEEPKNFLVQPMQKHTLFMQGKDLVRYSDAKLVSGVHFVLSPEINFKNKHAEFEPKEIAKKLGILVNLSIDNVYENFRKLTQVTLSIDAEYEIIDYAIEFYKYLGRQRKIETRDVPKDIKDTAIRINRKWIPANRVFKRNSKLDGIYSWTSISDVIQDEGTETNLTDGLEVLGVRDMPSTQILVDLLNEIPLNVELSKEAIMQVDLLLQEIQDVEDIEDYSIPILSRNKMLMDIGNLYINDLPAYRKAEIKNEELSFCKSQYDSLARKIGVDSLKEESYGQLNKEKTIFGDVKHSDIVDDLVYYIGKPHFKEGLLRLLFNENKISEDEIDINALTGSIPANIIIVEKLVVDFLAFSTFLYTDCEATTLEPKEIKDTLYILRQEDLDDTVDLISKYICQVKKLSDESLQYLMRILRRTMTKDVLDVFLDNKGVKELPIKFEVEKESIYLDSDEEYYQDTVVEDEDVIDLELDDEIYDEVTDSEQGLKDNMAKDTASNINFIDNSDFEVSGMQTDGEASSVANSDENEQDNNSDNNQTGSIDSGNQHSPSYDSQGSENPANREDNSSIPPPTTPREPQDEGISSSEDSNSNEGSTDKTSNARYGEQSQSDSTDDLVSSNDRKPVYVGNEKEQDEERSEKNREKAKNIGNKGENYILEHDIFLLSPDNNFFKAPTNNKGFDIIEQDDTGNIVRYIEVKTLTGQWGTGGVGVTISQLKFALEHIDKWWLIVVKGINTESVEVFQFKNPVVEATSFMFDNSWKQLAYNASNTVVKDIERIKELPVVGDIYRVNIEGNIKLYEITKVKSTKKLSYIWAIAEDESLAQKVDFNDSWEKV